MMGSVRQSNSQLSLPGKKILWKITKARSKSRAASPPMTSGAISASRPAHQAASCLPSRPFSCGILPFSAEGEAHFADCRVLFDLNRNVLLMSGGILAVLLLLQKKFGPYRLGKRHAAWWAGLLALIAPLVIGALAALDFDRAFVIFHQIFFPGKSNWLFNWQTDPIILALPQEFFRNCAILIGAGLVIFSLSLLIFTGSRDKKAGK